VFGKMFLGMTIACARCHDHKFDAISTKDYYALTGYLQSSRPDRAFLDERAERRKRLEPLLKLRAAIAEQLPPRKFPDPFLDQTGGVVFASFAKGSFDNWVASGDAFGDRPSAAGDVMI